jgi:hypothetical protein
MVGCVIWPLGRGTGGESHCQSKGDPAPERVCGGRAAVATATCHGRDDFCEEPHHLHRCFKTPAMKMRRASGRSQKPSADRRFPIQLAETIPKTQVPSMAGFSGSFAFGPIGDVVFRFAAGWRGRFAKSDKVGAAGRADRKRPWAHGAIRNLPPGVALMRGAEECRGNRLTVGGGWL